MSNKKIIYSPEFKSQAILLVREAGRPASTVAKELGINVTTLYYCLSSSTHTTPKKSSNAALSLENKRLKKALAQAQLERDILKKAAAYFAKETL